jgi:hypothetical protein
MMDVEGIYKIFMPNKFDCYIYLRFRKAPVKLYCADGKVEIFLDWFLRSCDGMTRDDHKLAYLSGSEDTQIINLEEVA